MRFSRVLLFVLLSGLPAKAETPNLDVGRGVLCDTAQEVERFVALRSDGKEAAVALQTVNKEAPGAAACNFVFVMFTGSKAISELSVNGRPVSILQITVHAFGDGSAWRQVPAIVRYTAAAEEGVLI